MIRAITICVDYADYLAVTLPINRKHFADILVVTSGSDHVTQDWCIKNEVPFWSTSAFYQYGAEFNKGLALEQAFDIVGRRGWIVVIDADTHLPPDLLSIDLTKLSIGSLYSAPRRMDDGRLLSTRGVMPGYFHLFHADDPALVSRPWYDVTFAHAGGGDGYFQSRWPKDRKIRLPFEVSHLGPADTNWYGRGRKMGERNRRVVVPGYEPQKWVYGRDN